VREQQRVVGGVRVLRQHGGQRTRRRLLLSHLTELPLQIEHLLPQQLIRAKGVPSTTLAPGGPGCRLLGVVGWVG